MPRNPKLTGTDHHKVVRHSPAGGTQRDPGIRRRLRLSGLGRRDRGAISALTGIALVPVLVATALVVDGGRVLVERERTQTAAEAGALAAAAQWAETGQPCADPAPAVALANTSPQAAVACTADGVATGGTITVQVDTEVDTLFGGLLGRSSAPTTASATAVIGAASSVRGLRPLGLCLNNPQVADWVASGYADTRTYRIALQDDGSACTGDVPGNWTVVNFTGGSSSNAVVNEWVRNGYPGSIAVPSTYTGVPGVSLDLRPVTGQQILVPLYDNASMNGSNAEYRVVSYAAITVIDSRLGGALADRWIDVKFHRAPVTGECCAPSTVNRGVTAWRICSLNDQGDCP